MCRLWPWLVASLLIVLATVAPAEAQVELCANSSYTPASGTSVCNGSAKPLAVSASVVTAAQLTLEEVFGAPATALVADFGSLDVVCLGGAPSAGVSCSEDTKKGYAIWYGNVRFSVKLGGAFRPVGQGQGVTRMTQTTAKLLGVLSPGASVPAGGLLDGPAGAVPSVAYQTGTGIELQTGIGAGRTVVSRSFGLKVANVDPPGFWSANTVYSVVME